MSSQEPLGRQEAQDKAIKLAREGGEAAARIDARFSEHGREIAILKREHELFRRDLEAMGQQVTKLVSAFGEHIAVGNALTDQVKEATAKQVTTRTFVWGLVGTVIALGMLLIAGIALIHGQAP